MTYPPQYAPQTRQYPPQHWPQDPGPAPATVRATFWIVIGQVVFSTVLGLPLAYLNKDAILAAQNPTPGVDPEALWSAAFALAVVIVLGSNALWLFFAAKLKQGRNWARLVMLVLTVLALVATPYNLANAGGVNVYTLVPAIVGFSTSVAILILLFTEPAKSWLAAKSAYLTSRRY